MVKLTLRVAEDLHNALVKAAVEDDRSLNGELVSVLKREMTRRGFLPALKDGASAPDHR